MPFTFQLMMCSFLSEGSDVDEAVLGTAGAGLGLRRRGGGLIVPSLVFRFLPGSMPKFVW